ncbi:glycoside hydrolase family 15 protein [Streptomyces sp. IBSBF 3136]|uniref:glycoside hydrolase family 15 protein n=1 Tax=Streptomyces sp. IBSBF 3136 TaxID=2903524 RepID=UPI002FDBB864
MTGAPARATPDRYLPIADHGLIGDLRTAALVGTDGTIDWYCCPSFDSPSVFAALLDADRGGSFELSPAVRAETKQFYFPDTNVLITRFFTEDGLGEIQDFMPVGDAADADRHRLIRRVVCVRGSIPFRARVSPRFGYGTQPHTVRMLDQAALFTSEALSLTLTSTVPMKAHETDVCAEFALSQGETAVLALDRVRDGTPPRGCSQGEAESEFTATVAFWRHWLQQSRYRGRWREMVHRSALTLKLLTYAPTGAIVAAFVQYEGGDVLDAALLMMPLTRFIAPHDPVWLSTLDALGHELVSDSLVWRYDPKASPDGLDGDEGTFSICSFWYVEALTRAGRLDEARLAFEKMLTYANHVGLYAEEISHTGEQLGNFPQAFTHLALISAAFNLDRALG